MADYGIQVDGNQGIFQIDSETTSTKYLATKQNATTTTSGSFIVMQSGHFDQSKGDIVFARPSTVSGTFSSHFGSTPPRFNVHASYVVLRPSTDTTHTNVNGTDYGIQVKNTAGDVIFDSRQSVSGMDIQKIFLHNTLVGGDQPNTFGWINAAQNPPVLDAGATIGGVHYPKLMYTGNSTDWSKTYVSVNGGRHTGSIASGSSGVSSDNSYIFNGFYFDSTNYKIYFQAFMRYAGTIIGNVGFSNFGAIMVGILKG